MDCLSGVRSLRQGVAYKSTDSCTSAWLLSPSWPALCSCRAEQPGLWYDERCVWMRDKFPKVSACCTGSCASSETNRHWRGRRLMLLLLLQSIRACLPASSLAMRPLCVAMACLAAPSSSCASTLFVQASEHWLVLARDAQLEGPLDLGSEDAPLLEQMVVSGCLMSGLLITLYRCFRRPLPPQFVALVVSTRRPKGSSRRQMAEFHAGCRHSAYMSARVLCVSLFPQAVASNRIALLKAARPHLRFRFGFHAVPSCRQLHMHVISQVGLCVMCDHSPTGGW